tara:strand:- start:1013 stop:1246 length:234 start_codon:yes stop_codon:yes gene_type:complete
MGDRFVPAARSMDMTLVVSVASVAGRTCGRVDGRDRDFVLIYVTVVGVVEVSVVDVVDVPVMVDCLVATARAMYVVV